MWKMKLFIRENGSKKHFPACGYSEISIAQASNRLMSPQAVSPEVEARRLRVLSQFLKDAQSHLKIFGHKATAYKILKGECCVNEDLIYTGTP